MNDAHLWTVTRADRGVKTRFAVWPKNQLRPLARRARFPMFLVGLTIVCASLFVAAAPLQLAPYDMAKMSPQERLQPPSLAHPFGTDMYGRDLLSRVIGGARLSIGVALLSVLAGAVPGISAGLLAGMYPGRLERVVSRVMDAWMAVPGLLLAITVVAILGRSPLVLALALGLAGVPGYYRQTRVETLRTRGHLFVSAARALGARERHILRCHILPHVLPMLVAFVSLRIGGLLVAISALNFIGLGAQPPQPEWGALLAEGREFMEQAWWLTFFPGCAIAITVFGFNLVGDGLRDRLDPHVAAARKLPD